VEFLTRLAITQWRLTALLVSLAIAAGAFTYLNQPGQEDPEIVIRTAVVTCANPGMSAERIEQLVIKPIEEAVKQIAEIEQVRSAAQAGSATIKVELLPTVTDVKPVWSDLRHKLDDLAASLPEGTIGPLVNDDYGRVAVTTLALVGSDFEMAELRGEARRLRDRISALPLVARVDLYGVQDERIWLSFERARLAQLGLEPQVVLDAIAQQNQILPSGAVLSEEGMRYTLEPSGDFRAVAEVGDVPVRTPAGTIVYVRDVLDVERGYVDPPRRPVLFDGRPAVVIAVAMLPNVDIKAFGAQIDALLATERDALPLGMSLELITHQPPIVAAAVGEATSNLGQTLVTVLVVVMLFLGIRAGAIVGTIVPLTIFLTLVGMLLWEIPLHRVSIAAVIIALGLLVDNGVVVTEDIKQRLDAGNQRLDAALAASRTLAVPLLTSSLTTVLAFLPLMLAPDATGEFLRALAQVIAITLLSSWLLSITVTPLLCVRFLPEPEGSARETSRWNRRLQNAYERILVMVLRFRSGFLVAMGLLFAAALLAMARVPTGLLPPSARAQFVVKLELPAGTSEFETLRVTRRLARWLADRAANPEVTSNVFYVADGGPRFFLALSPLDPAPHIAFGVVNTRSSDDVAPVRQRVEAFLAAQLPEGRGWTELLFLGQEPPGTVEIRLAGPDIDGVYQTGRRIEALLASIPGTRQVRNDWANPVLQIDLLIDQERSRRAGVPPAAIARALEANFDGARITDYREGDRIIPVMLRARPEDRATLDDLGAVTILAADGTPVPLIQIAKLAGELVPYTIRRFDLERTITVSGMNPRLSAAQLLAELEPKLDALDLPTGFHWSAGGEVEASRDANQGLFLYMPQCLIAIVVLLVWQFASFRRTAIILLTIPLVLIGASLGLNLLSAKLDFNAMLGLFALAGIIVNNAIVLIEKIDEERSSGLGLDAALRSAGRARLRPIVMTTLTTVVGLLPLCLLGGELWFAMTLVLMFGLSVGTVLTLGVVPTLYAAMFRQAPSDRIERGALPGEAT
jgi:multidrug efflux pump subunit AcrB